MIFPDRPALVLAPMDGITDAPMRALMGEWGASSHAVTEFLRVSINPLPEGAIRRSVPELETGGRTASGLPVQVQLLGGDPDRMALSAAAAVRAGATSIDLNFGCPAPTVNRNDGGASLLRHPCRIREIVQAVRSALPTHVPVSAKLRLGWDSVEDVLENAPMAVEGGASWLTLHARTKMQGYQPPVDWQMVGRVRALVPVPVIANGDIWNLEDFLRCQDVTGCQHFMIGRAALANPPLAGQIARSLGMIAGEEGANPPWIDLLERLTYWTATFEGKVPERTLLRLKQWIKLAHLHGEFEHFDALKRATSVGEFFATLQAESPEID